MQKLKKCNFLIRITLATEEFRNVLKVLTQCFHDWQWHVYYIVDLIGLISASKAAICVCFLPPLKASLMARTDHCNCRSNLETPATTYLEGVFTFNLSNWDLPNVFQYHGNFHAEPSGDCGDQETGEIDLKCIRFFNNCKTNRFKDPFEWPATNFGFYLTVFATVSFCLFGNAPWFHFRFSSSVCGCGATTGLACLA